jgi:hypothetical protein
MDAVPRSLGANCQGTWTINALIGKVSSSTQVTGNATNQELTASLGPGGYGSTRNFA